MNAANVLAAEIRLQIYDLVLVDRDAPIIIEPEDEGDRIEPRVAYTWLNSNRLALTYTCEEIRFEAFPVYLSSNTFRIAPNFRQDHHSLATTTRLCLSYLGDFAQDLCRVDANPGDWGQGIGDLGVIGREDIDCTVVSRER